MLMQLSRSKMIASVIADTLTAISVFSGLLLENVADHPLHVADL